MRTYACTVLAAGGLSFVLTPLVAWVARRKKVVDRPDPRKVHAADIPRVGGIAMVLATLVSVAVVMMLRNIVGAALRDVQTGLIVILAGASLVSLVGLVDDVFRLRARFKFMAQIAVACGVCAFGIRIQAVAVRGVFAFDLGWLSWPITLLWIVGITNAVNLIDGLDGLCAGICAAACAVAGVFAIHTNQAIMAVLMAALLGSLLGFLYHNFNPAKIFMGDCGTYFVGFILATASVFCATKASTIVGLAIPALALGVPIFDTLFSILRRFLERRPIFSPDRGHIHHRLMDMGLRHRHVVLLLYAATAVSAGLGLFMMLSRDAGQLIILAGVIILLVILFRAAGSVSFRHAVAGIRRRLQTARAVSENQRCFEEAELRLRFATTFDAWWQILCEAAAKMQFSRLSLFLPRSDGTDRTLSWQRPGPDLEPQEAFRASFPIRRDQGGPPFTAEVETPVNGSLELTGQRLAYFARLADGYNLADPPPTDEPGASR
ncbi:MAG: undecaprenyl/decaprenyl-phosphate alpha-N-acetylglucosaminyl 1-phosphate transferase [Planctomycetes bacterium]|nr:undecaprenyl/decaprenyl-phosphate alpha-N-acetylglucosaminyl 1-phosphate transferase [Planctomycetota bacterium]